MVEWEEYIADVDGNYEVLPCRCKDCKYFQLSDETPAYDWCEYMANWIPSKKGNGYCAWGVKKNEN